MHEQIRQWILVAAVFAVPLATAEAQEGTIDKRLVLSVLPEYGVARGHAPVSLAVTLRWLQPELIEGHLQLEWFVDQTKLGRYVSGEMALSDSSVKLSVVLPPVILPHDSAHFNVQGKFITARTVYDLDVHDVMLQPDWRRILIVGVCQPPAPKSGTFGDLDAKQQRSELPGRFDLGPFFESRFTKRELYVDSTDIDPADVPTDPLKMTAFDVFVIPAQSLSKLKQRQRDSLLEWVRAGGSLCLFVDGGLPDAHLAWLNQLAGRDVADAAYLQDAEGRVVAAEEAPLGLHKHNPGLGRTVVVLEKPDSGSDDWEQAVLFLWKVRADRRNDVLNDRLWKLEEAEFRDTFDMYVRLEPQRLWQEPQLTQFLLPDSVQGLPLGTVSLVLVLFLIVIAPGDYLVLGWLKRRRWTWVLFPTVSLLFTGYTMWLARQHLGQTSYERSITVVDVGRDGGLLRTSRFEMLYAASNRTVTADQQRSLMVPLDPNSDRLAGQLAASPRSPREYEQPWTFTGRVPQNYSVHRDVQQWSPRMARVTTFGASDAALAVTPVPVPSLFAEDDLSEDSAIMPASIDGPLTVMRLSHDDRTMLQHDSSLPATIVGLAETITRRPGTGFFSLVSQLSPTSGGNWEDLTLLDRSDPQQFAIVAVSSPEEGQYIIYRRLGWEED